MLFGIFSIVLVLCIVVGFMWPGIGLFVSVLLTIGCCFEALFSNAGEVDAAFLVALSIFPATLLAALLSGKKNEQGRPAKSVVIAKWLLGIIIMLLLLVALLVTLHVLGFIFFAMIMSSIIAYFVASKYSLAVNVLSTIGACIRQNLPLAMGLEAAAGDNYDKQSCILRNISTWLTQGYSLTESLKRGYPKCPADIVSVLKSAENIGQLPAAIKSAEADIMEKAEQAKKIKPVHPSYPLIVFTVLATVLLGLMIFIIPVFAEVLSDMSGGKEGLPRQTLLLLDISGWLLGRQGLNAIVVLAFVFMIYCTWFYTRYRPRRPQSPYLTSRIGDFVKWHFPFTHWFEKNYSLLKVVQVLKVSLNAGVTVDKAIENTLELDVNCWFRYRLSKWLAAVAEGENISIAAVNTGVGKTIGWAFDNNVNRSNTPEILEMLEEFHRNNYNYRVNIAKSIFWPFMIVGMGCMVGFVVYSLFLPMIAMLNFAIYNVAPY